MNGMAYSNNSLDPSTVSSPFEDRHIGISTQDEHAILAQLGYHSTEELVSTVIPEVIHLSKPLAIPDACSEEDALLHLKRYVSRNILAKNFIGMGYYGTFTPPVILRNILENPAWYTAYTPYQPEISQGPD
jgi:glycine dehydrogenase